MTPIDPKADLGYGPFSLTFDTVFVAMTLTFALWMILRCLVFKDRFLQRDLYRYSCTTTWLMRRILGVRVEVRGLENLPKDKAFIMASKHMSWLDPIMSLQYTPSVRGLAKKELFSIPLVGKVLALMENIRVDREAGKAGLAMNKIAEQLTASTRPLMIYPEGTRLKPGETKSLKAGVFHLHQASGLDVVPIKTNSGWHWRGVGSKTSRGTIIYDIQPTLPHTDDKSAFMESLEGVLADSLPANPA